MNQAAELIRDFQEARPDNRAEIMVDYPPKRLDRVVQALRERQVGFTQVLQWAGQEINTFIITLSSKSVEDTSATPWQDKLKVHAHDIIHFSDFITAIKNYFEVLNTIEYQADIYEMIKTKEESDLRKSTELQERYGEVIGVMLRYFDKVVAALKLYIGTQKHKTIPFELTQFPLTIHQAEVKSLVNLKTFIHDMSNIFSSMEKVSQPVVGYGDLYFESYGDDAESNSQEKMRIIQNSLVRMMELLQSFDFEKGTFICVPTPVVMLEEVLENFIINTKKGGAYTTTITEDSSLPTDFESGTYQSYLDKVLFRRIIGNIEQNIQRMMQGNAERFAERPLHISIRYRYVSGKVVKENQIIKGGQGQWLEITIADNGPGFPIKDSDKTGNQDNQSVVYYHPEVGKTNHKNVRGSGLGLAGILAIVEEYGGEFLTYTPYEEVETLDDVQQEIPSHSVRQPLHLHMYELLAGKPKMRREKKTLGAITKIRVPVIQQV